jgi:hypothetical protein
VEGPALDRKKGVSLHHVSATRLVFGSLTLHDMGATRFLELYLGSVHRRHRRRWSSRNSLVINRVESVGDLRGTGQGGGSWLEVRGRDRMAGRWLYGDEAR